MRIFFSIGVSEKTRVDQLVSEGVNRVLFSFGEFKDKRGELQTWFKPFREILIDSGAFAHGKSGMRVDLDQYRSFLKSIEETELYPWKKQVQGYFNLDVMNDPEQTQWNQSKLEKAELRPIPVFHYGEDEAILERMCAQYDYIGLGGLAIGQVNTDTLKKFWNRVANEYPNTKFHMLGTNQLRAFVDHEPFSIDATTWIADSWGHLVSVAKDGGPQIGYIQAPLNEDLTFDKNSHRGLGIKKAEVAQHFFTADELRRNNIRALLYFEKMEWAKNLRGAHQESMF